jgi:hypothetical protein
MAPRRRAALGGGLPMSAGLVLVVVLLIWIVIKLERVEKQAKRASMSEVDREMDELNPTGISS